MPSSFLSMELFPPACNFIKIQKLSSKIKKRITAIRTLLFLSSSNQNLLLLRRKKKLKKKKRQQTKGRRQKGRNKRETITRCRGTINHIMGIDLTVKNIHHKLSVFILNTKISSSSKHKASDFSNCLLLKSFLRECTHDRYSEQWWIQEVLRLTWSRMTSSTNGDLWSVARYAKPWTSSAYEHALG